MASIPISNHSRYIKPYQSFGGSLSIKPHGLSLHNGKSKTMNEHDSCLEPIKKVGGSIDSLQKDLANLKLVEPDLSISAVYSNNKTPKIPFARKRNISFTI